MPNPQMTLVDILRRELSETKHYSIYESNFGNHHRIQITCNCVHFLCEVKQDSIHYKNRRGPAILYAADPHFFNKLKKLLDEIHRRELRSQLAFEKSLRNKVNGQ